MDKRFFESKLREKIKEKERLKVRIFDITRMPIYKAFELENNNNEIDFKKKRLVVRGE